MDHKKIRDTAVIAAAVVGTAAIFFLIAKRVTAMSERTGTLGPGQSPVTVIDTTPTATDSGPQGSPCRAVMQWPWHLRPNETAAMVGRNYPAGTEVQILQRGTLTRWGAQMFKVKVLRDQREGWAFVQPSEIRGNCRPA
jgi:hypothetical protein